MVRRAGISQIVALNFWYNYLWFGYNLSGSNQYSSQSINRVNSKVRNLNFRSKLICLFLSILLQKMFKGAKNV